MVVTVGGGFELLDFPAAGVAGDAAELTAILAAAREPVAVDELPVDWSTHAAVVLAIPSDLCPPLLADIEVEERIARPVFVDAGYQACPEPLLSHTIIAAVDRDVLAGADQLVLPADEPFFEDPVAVPVDVATATEEPEPDSADRRFGRRRGGAALPPVGDAVTSELDDGTLVFLVHHHDGSVSALDPRARMEGSGRSQLVSWIGEARQFIAQGAWDEYGRRLDGSRTSDLQGFATRVDGEVVDIGAPVDPPSGTPIVISTSPPGPTDLVVEASTLLDLTDATALPQGHAAWIDTALVIDGDGGRLCVRRARCPADAPAVPGIEPTADRWETWHGPTLATRTANGFERVATTGGMSGGTTE